MPVLFIQGEEEKKKGIHYEVDMSLPPLGEGGMGQVRKGVRVVEGNGIRQNVAIKFLFEDLPSHAIERARREASIMIHNENLVEMFGFIEVAESHHVKRYHVVSELLEGVMLFDLLNGKTTDQYGREVDYAKELYTKWQNDKFGFAVLITKNVLSGLMALHDKGYIHRDLDPSNIMITSDRKIKIIDYGIAKQLDSLNTQDKQLTNTGQFIGKAAYAAPELVLGDIRSQNRTTDIYAVGIMLYQFVVGSLPFEGTMAELIDHQLHSKLPLKTVPYKKIRKIIEKATSKKQIDRYQSATEMRVDLEHLTKADAIPSKTAIDVVVELPLQKKKVGVTVFAAIFIFAIAGIILFFNQSRGLSEEELMQMRIDSLFKVRNGMVTDDAGISEVTDAETGAKMRPIGLLTKEALDKIESGKNADISSGVKQLKEIAEQYSTYKNSAYALSVLAAITQPTDVSISSAYIKELREKSAEFMVRDSVSAHEYAEKAVANDKDCYQGYFELATDYMFGELRTGEKESVNLSKALNLFKEGKKSAESHHDEEYVNLFVTRIEQIEQIANDE